MTKHTKPSSELLVQEIRAEHGVKVPNGFGERQYIRRRSAEINADHGWLRNVTAGSLRGWALCRRLAEEEWRSGKAIEYLMRWFGVCLPQRVHPARGLDDDVSFEPIRPKGVVLAFYQHKPIRKRRAARRYESSQQIAMDMQRQTARQVAEMLRSGLLTPSALLVRSGIPLVQQRA